MNADTGTIIFWSGSQPPTGWLFKTGDISRTTYANLFSVIGTTEGQGNGSTTFGLGEQAYLPGSLTCRAIIKY